MTGRTNRALAAFAAMCASLRGLARTAIPPLAAPVDLVPKTAAINLPLKPGGVRVRVALGGPEITQMNNEVALPGVLPKPILKLVKRHHRGR